MLLLFFNQQNEQVPTIPGLEFTTLISLIQFTLLKLEQEFTVVEED